MKGHGERKERRAGRWELSGRTGTSGKSEGMKIAVYREERE